MDSAWATVRSAATRYGGAVIGLGLVGAAAGNAAGYPSGPRLLAGVLSALTAGAVLLRRRSPWAMTLSAATGFAALAVVGIGVTPMWAFVELLLVAFWATEGLPPDRAAWAVGLLFAAGVAFDARAGGDGAAGAVVSPLVIVGAPALAGALLRRSRTQAAQLRALTVELAEQRDRAAAAAELAERAAIAREIHDVVAHTVSVMLVQAGAAEQLLEPEHPATASVSAIRATGKQALAELRRVVGVLRAGLAQDTHPQPTLADLPDLLAAARAGGAAVALVSPDDLGDLPPGIQLTAFRTVQEALTNVRKHAGGAAVTVRLHRDPTALRVVIDDDGGGAPRDQGEPGFGLMGLRERADLYAATFSCGRRPDGPGWRVDVTIPVDERPRTREAAS